MQTNDFQTLERQWAMLRAIPARPQTITATSLLDILRNKGFTPSRRTIERDLHEISLRFPLTCDNSVKPFRWGWMQDAALEFMPGLTVSQCLALTLTQAHMQGLLPSSMLADLVPLFEAAERQLANTEWKDWHKRTAVAPPAFALLPPKIDAKVLTDVQHAITRRLCLTAKYRSIGSKAPKTRTIHPHGLLIRGSVQYLVCLLPEYADEPRQLCLHRMSATTLGTERCRELHGFSMRRYARKLTIASTGKIRLRLLVDETSAEHIRETPLSKYQTWRPVAGTNKVEVSATVDDDVELKRWLLSLGSEAQVLAPEHLRVAMMEELTKAAGAYGK